MTAAKTRMPRLILCAAALPIALLTARAALAADALVTPSEERWKTECASCHVAYPPRLLTAPAWRRLMSGLDRHFGTDASVDAQTARAIGAFLEQNAGTGRRATDTLRITEGRWFLRKHDEVPAVVWKTPAVKSAANCEACHVDAARGGFSERNVRIPR